MDDARLGTEELTMRTRVFAGRLAGTGVFDPIGDRVGKRLLMVIGAAL